MIPGDILHFFSSFLDSILSVQIMRHHLSPDAYTAVIRLESPSTALQFKDNFHGRQFLSLEPIPCQIYLVRMLAFSFESCPLDAIGNMSPSPSPSPSPAPSKSRSPLQNVATMFVPVPPVSVRSALRQKCASPPTSLWTPRSDSTLDALSNTELQDISRSNSGGSEVMNTNLKELPFQTKRVRKAGSRSDLPNTALLSPVPASAKTASVYSVHQLSEKCTGHEEKLDSESEFEESSCPLCLEAIATSCPRSFTSCCSHVFHINCISKLTGAQCPICRFQHDASPLTFTECSQCRWQNRDREAASGDGSGPGDLWVCLVCGFIGCGSSHEYHIRAHYETCLHAYAMNTESRRVWDFAGDGYVHRLILLKSDPDDDFSASTTSITGPSSQPVLVSPRLRALRVGPGEAHVDLYSGHGSGPEDFESRPHLMKVVEAMDPRQLSDARAPWSTPREDESAATAMGGRSNLEDVAAYYSHQLAWQLALQRKKFETDLELIRSARGDSSMDKSVSSHSISRSLLHSLAIEKNKIMRQTEAARTRLSAVREEKATLVELNRCLSDNQKQWDSRLIEALGTLGSAEMEYRQANVLPTYLTHSMAVCVGKRLGEIQLDWTVGCRVPCCRPSVHLHMLSSASFTHHNAPI